LSPAKLQVFAPVNWIEPISTCESDDNFVSCCVAESDNLAAKLIALLSEVDYVSGGNGVRQTIRTEVRSVEKFGEGLANCQRSTSVRRIARHQ
jgi:hypothetical protein